MIILFSYLFLFYIVIFSYIKILFGIFKIYNFLQYFLIEFVNEICLSIRCAMCLWR